MVAITRKMNRFDAAARSIKTVEAMQKAWRKHIGKPLTSQSALNFLQHYRRMTKKQSMSKTKHGKKQRGGAAYTLSGASTDYVMAPGQAGNAMAAGFPVLAAYGPQQYGHFTDDVTSYKPLLNNVGGPAEIPKIAQLADCGVDRFPTDPRLAQVGAGYGKKRRLNRMNRSRNSSRSSRNSRNPLPGRRLFARHCPQFGPRNTIVIDEPELDGHVLQDLLLNLLDLLLGQRRIIGRFQGVREPPALAFSYRG